MLPSPIKNFADVFAKLPAIGPRAAIRLAFHIAKQKPENVAALGRAVAELASVSECPRCFYVKNASSTLCQICESPEREKGVIAIVEKETDVLTIEKSGAFRGSYLVFGPPSERGILDEHQKAKIASLKKRAAASPDKRLKEIIVALNPSVVSDLAYDAIKRDLGEHTDTVTRLGRGIPTGGEIEFSDMETLKSAIERRT